MTKVLLICVSTSSVLTFRKKLIISLVKRGANVSVIAFDRKYENEIAELGAHFYFVNGTNRSLNPFKMFQIQGGYRKIIAEIKPDVVFCFQLKPNLFGVPAAKKAGVEKVYAMVEGAGEPFTYKTFKWTVIRFVVCLLYRKSLRYARKVFFLNNDDASEFCSRGIVKDHQVVIINGIGVDLTHFGYSRLDKKSNDFVMIARLNHSKGVFTYLKAAEYVRKIHPESRFFLAGDEGTIRVKKIETYINNGVVNYCGVVKDVRGLLKQSIGFVLPSFYREGLPASIMEAEAVGRCVITTNNVGCKNTVIDGFNGFLIEKNDWEGLAQKCIYLLEHKTVADKMGQNARSYAEENYDSTIINQEIISYLL